MYTTYVLFVIWSNYYKGWLGIIQQDFYTGKECELAKNALVAACKWRKNCNLWLFEND